MRLSDFKNEEALDLLVEILEPVSTVFSDEEVAVAYKEKGKLEAIKVAIKNHKKEVLEILALLDGKDPEKYEISFLALPIKLLQILNDPELADLFSSQGQMGEAISFGSVMENTEEKER